MVHSPVSSSTTVLVADPSADRRARAEVSLVAVGFRVVGVATADGLADLAQYRPDLIIIGSGLSAGVIGDLRADPLTRDVPVLEWSEAGVSADDMAASLRSGATMLLGEPTSSDALVASVRALLRLRDQQRQVDVALSMKTSGVFDWAIPTGEVRWSESLERIHGLEPGGFGGTFDDFLSFVEPDEVDRVGGVIEEVLDSGAEYNIVYRARTCDGSTLWIEGHGRLFRDGDGQPAKLLGVAFDVTEREQNSERMGELRRLAAALNTDDSTDDILATVGAALARHDYRAELHDVSDAVPDPAPGAMRHRTALFVLDVIPPSADVVRGSIDPAVHDQVTTITELAISALRRGWRFDIERETASMLQTALLPTRLPSPDGWSVSGRYVPTFGAGRLGGDFYDVVATASHVVGIIGDVAGHGLDATADMGSMRNLLRILVLQTGADPADVLRQAAALTAPLLGDVVPFVTALVVSVEIATGVGRFASAGHPPALLRSADGVVVLTDATAVSSPLGTGLDGGPSDSGRFVMAPGDVIVSYTDGVIEGRDRSLDASIDDLATAIAARSGVIDADAVISLADRADRNDDDRAVLCIGRGLVARSSG